MQMLTGPDLVNSLCGVLLRFREHPYVLVANIKAMFHQVIVPQSDRDALRFLWWTNGEFSNRPISYRMTVHSFEATSLPSCTSRALRQAFKTFMTPYGDEATTAKQFKEALASGGFNLTCFFSNVEGALCDLPEAISNTTLLQVIVNQTTKGER
ncbi:hypothetical protein X801_02097 [Opisthorchis viverrini]|uniref:Reverse transcriptase domain-containing protein n=1 Tax=Opisthorchis viverrini TaxID=6198 RepID=A0A1S8X5N4_OPIVI|nr:hypothetical protein X801_02097 [Opisthorchis viverrini]